ncbi:MAG: hypothetical protein ABW108_01855, partial [Candidatus Thiodiazotropha sp. 6PLUC10]
SYRWVSGLVSPVWFVRFGLASYRWVSGLVLMGVRFGSPVWFSGLVRFGFRFGFSICFGFFVVGTI